MLPMIVAKFGGTSVSSAKSIKTICSIVSKEIGRNPVVVVSALSGITDLLLSLHNLPKSHFEDKIQTIKTLHISLLKKLWKEGAPDECLVFIHKQINEIKKCLNSRNFNKGYLDKIASFGEIMSSYIIAKVLNAKGISAKQIIATDLIITDDSFGSAEFLVNPTKVRVKRILQPLIKKRIVPVITGFIGSTKDGQVTTLGRGGSDYTASIIGFCLGVDEIQIWTDVDGIMTADPTVVKNARTVKLVSYKEAAELAVLGAKVLHPKTILPAIEKNIPVRILNTDNPNSEGTTIVREVYRLNQVTSISCKKNIKLIHIRAPKMFLMHGFLHKIFKIFDELKISVDFVSTSEISISLTIDGSYDIGRLVEELNKFADVEVRNKHATVSVIGRPIGTAPVILGRVYTLLENKKIDVEMISASASKINETIVIKEKDADGVVRMLHKTFFNS